MSLTDKLPLWQACVLAFCAMAVTDTLGTMMVVLEAAHRGWTAGGCDALTDISTLIGSSVAIDSVINSKHGILSRRTLSIVASTSIASVLATVLGVHLAVALHV